MQMSPPIWRADDQNSQLPSEYPARDIVKFYAHRALKCLVTLFLSFIIFSIVILAIRHPYVFSALAILILLMVIYFVREGQRTVKPRFVQEGRIVEGVYVLHLSDKLVADNYKEYVNQVRTLLERGYRHILIDLSDVSYIDAAGVGALVSCFTMVQKYGGQLKLLNLAQGLEHLIKIETYYDEKIALASFAVSNKYSRKRVL